MFTVQVASQCESCHSQTWLRSVIFKYVEQQQSPLTGPWWTGFIWTIWQHTENNMQNLLCSHTAKLSCNDLLAAHTYFSARRDCLKQLGIYLLSVFSSSFNLFICCCSRPCRSRSRFVYLLGTALPSFHQAWGQHSLDWLVQPGVFGGLSVCDIWPRRQEGKVDGPSSWAPILICTNHSLEPMYCIIYSLHLSLENKRQSSGSF